MVNDNTNLKVNEIITRQDRGQGKGESRLVPLLLALQAEFGYLPPEAIGQIGDHLGMTAGQVYSVASFYTHFKLKPIGKKHITVCRGTACHIRGAPQIADEVNDILGIGEGETSEDREYSFETVACIGCCALAPALKINDHVHGNITPREAADLFSDIKKRAAGDR